MKEGTGIAIAIGVGVGMLLLGNLAEAQPKKPSSPLERLKEGLGLKASTPLTIGDDFIPGQTVPAPGVYVDRTTRVVYATEPDGRVLVKSEKATHLLRALPEGWL